MKIYRQPIQHMLVTAARMANSTAAFLIAVLSISMLASCGGGNTNRVVSESQWNDVEPERLPIDFNPPFEMTIFSATQALMQRGKVLATQIIYINAEEASQANFFVQDLQDIDMVFIESSGGSTWLENTLNRKPSGAVKSVGESKDTSRLKYQHYLLNSDEACILIVKYAGSDGSGDITTGGTPIGSVSIFADICESGTEQLTSQRRAQWIDSFNYKNL